MLLRMARKPPKAPQSKPLGKRLEKARSKAGYSREQLAQALGVNQTTVWRWEEGLQVPRPVKLFEIARVLGQPVDVLLFGAPKPIAVNGEAQR